MLSAISFSTLVGGFLTMLVNDKFARPPSKQPVLCRFLELLVVCKSILTALVAPVKILEIA